jgi:nitroreductase/NAD-dependent dihydropyrimidine dehydrogenase PreA subunit
MNHIEIDKNLCLQCGLCAQVCPNGIFKKTEENIRIIDKLLKNCINCGHCMAVCPNSALSLNGVKGIAKEPFDSKILARQLPLLLKQRRSIRVFDDNPIKIEDVESILDNLRYAPTAKNTQQVEYILLTGQSLDNFVALCYETVKNLEEYSSFYDVYHRKNRDVLFRNAPALLLAHAPKDRYMSIVDCTITLALFDMFAPVFNIGSCWAGYIMNLVKIDGVLEKTLKIKKDNAIYGALLLGHSAIDYASIPLRQPLHLTILK